jgi:hypothetical protein
MNTFLFGLIALVAASIYVTAWTRPSALRSWRDRLDERGETSLTLVIVVVALIVAVTVLIALDKEVPSVLSQGLASGLFGVIGGEATLARRERRAGSAVHPARARKKVPAQVDASEPSDKI